MTRRRDPAGSWKGPLSRARRGDLADGDKWKDECPAPDTFSEFCTMATFFLLSCLSTMATFRNPANGRLDDPEHLGYA